MSDIDDLDDISELIAIDPDRVDGVGQPASGMSFVLLKSKARNGAKPKSSFGRNAGRKLSPAAREAFQENARRVKAGKRPKAKTAKRKKEAGSGLPARTRVAWRASPKKRAVRAARMAAEASGYSQEIPATNCVGEAASILAAVTGESSGMCSARTMAGTPCQRPAVAGGRCHLHN